METRSNSSITLKASLCTHANVQLVEKLISLCQKHIIELEILINLAIGC